MLKKEKNINLLTYLFIIIVGYLYAIYTFDYNNFSIYYISLLIILSFTFIMYFYLKEFHNNKMLNLKNKSLMENQTMYSSVLEEFKKIKHNLLNDFIFISSLCDKNT
ncbi:MAG: hypothetical protein PHF21_03040, partial [Bacilli bacterium]|nr:hypothetical protein [Bacilli bacterium]